MLGTGTGPITLLIASLALGSGPVRHRAREHPISEHVALSRSRVGRPAPNAAATVVSLEFDHALSDALPGVQLANRYGMKVTLFAISGRIGEPTYMTVAELQQLQADGNEIGGHTIDHADLSQLGVAAQRKEICGDRAALESDGFEVIDFAYPYGHFNAATPGIARSCGYESARGAGGLESQGGCYGPCPAVETIPPHHPFDTWTINSVLEGTSLATIERYVRRAERDGGGWVQLVFHYVCDGCNLYSVSYSKLARLIPWLAAQGVRVETVREVLNTPFNPTRVSVRAGGATVRLTAVERCPSTPVTAVCTHRRRSTLRRLGVRAGATVDVLTGRGALDVGLDLRLRGRITRALRARRPRGGTRWRFDLPTVALRGSATVQVRFRLGVATYRLALGPGARS